MNRTLEKSLPAVAAAAALLCGAAAHAAERVDAAALKRVVDAAIQPLMRAHDVPGMAVSVTAGGRQYDFHYGVAARAGGRKVDAETLFEIGSVSKTFTATLGAYAQARGDLSLADNAAKYLPQLAGSSVGATSLLDLATYAAGGLPLQFPATVTDTATMVDYFRNWRPRYAAGTHRQYSNPSIGLFGYLAARSMGQPFEVLMERTLLPALGLRSTYITVPKARMGDYAYGYGKDGKPVRVTPGVLDAEAYGVKTTSADMMRFVTANIDSSGLDETLQRALATTRTGYFKVGDMVQGLAWEMYPWPAQRDSVLAGSSPQVVFEANAVARLQPPQAARADMLVNKTGSTNGFGAYVAYVPSRRIGIVMLANKNYPVAERVKAAFQVLQYLDGQPAGEGKP
ncbi:beta-lactamase/D-ala carboxypeptidase; penicillin resistance, penicillin-binding protein (PBP) [Cupriavidus taiwanensis]|uniref:Beta-lactamase n=1 Tax=Cupriavidus taiwanensis TaxID=164546 RepID=A0A975XB75_9BURK|nr:class C beta-lactamase [Cupriavidus taiwanensis]SOY64311.1 beta-lactamase/D-ala carboxypeptidase; penicillin resistance, penicillin-binding protein (PBP) [Cupriavidus taiwanensis]